VWANAENQAYYEMLKERFKVQIKAPQVPGHAGLIGNLTIRE
jgi:hypothetical protein